MNTTWTRRILAAIAIVMASMLHYGCAEFDGDTAALDEFKFGQSSQWPSLPRTPLSNTQPTIYGTEASLAGDGNTLTLTVYGGQSPYRWGVSDVSLGSIIESRDDAAVYQRNAAGDNAVTVVDRNGRTAYYDVAQP